MRRPIQQQLLVPMLVVVLAGVAVASLAGAWLGAKFAREQEQENLRRLAGTLVDAGFPLSENVLRKMAGLSGADFAVLDHDGRLMHSTLSLSDTEVADLQRQDSAGGPLPEFSMNLSSSPYRAARLPIRTVPPQSEGQSLYALYPEEHWDRVGLTTFLARRFTSRVRQLSEQASAIAAGQFTSRSLPATDDELLDLATALNRMAEQLGRYEEQVRRSERLRTLGQIGAGIAHQLRNSATGALMALEFHQADLDASTDRESLDVALRQLRLMETSLKRFLHLGRGDQLPKQEVSLRALVEEILPLIGPACQHANIQLDWQRPEAEVVVTGEPDSLRQLLLNLLVNAIEAATRADGQAGVIRVELDRTPTGTSLRVLDSGPGPTEAMSQRLFEPFATSKPDGTGLGLSVAREIATAHGAELTWQRIAETTCFELQFPNA
jgi:signal transduction histidine kinase